MGFLRSNRKTYIKCIKSFLIIDNEEYLTRVLFSAKEQKKTNPFFYRNSRYLIDWHLSGDKRGKRGSRWHRALNLSISFSKKEILRVTGQCDFPLEKPRNIPNARSIRLRPIVYPPYLRTEIVPKCNPLFEFLTPGIPATRFSARDVLVGNDLPYSGNRGYNRARSRITVNFVSGSQGGLQRG